MITVWTSRISTDNSLSNSSRWRAKGGGDGESSDDGGDSDADGGGFELPKFELPSFGGGDFRLFPDDVEFTDVDGDYVVVRKASGGTVDLYVNKKLKFEGARMNSNGNMLEVTGSVKQGFAFLGALGFQLEDIVTEGVQPTNPADLEKAMALVE